MAITKTPFAVIARRQAIICLAFCLYPCDALQMAVALLGNGEATAVSDGASGSPEIVGQTSKPYKLPGYTGEILLRTRPKTYYKVVNMLAAGEAVCNIAAQCKVSTRTVDAISERRAVDIAERKKTIVANLGDVAQLGSELMTQKIRKASFRDLTIGTGVAVDKVLALLGQTPVVQIANVIMPSDADRMERRALHDKLDAITARLNATP